VVVAAGYRVLHFMVVGAQFTERQQPAAITPPRADLRSRR
jgi:hypothetical protein